MGEIAEKVIAGHSDELSGRDVKKVHLAVKNVETLIVKMRNLLSDSEKNLKREKYEDAREAVKIIRVSADIADRNLKDITWMMKN